MMIKKTISRAGFIKKTAAAAVFANLGTLSAYAETHGDALGSERIQLKESGPMLPPVPAILLTVNGLEEGKDEISVVWTFINEGKPPQIGISVADYHVAQKMIEKHGEFVLNVPIESIVKEFDHIDMNSSKMGDKFKLSGLTRVKASNVNAPAIKESPIHVECKVIQTIAAPPQRKIFIGEVVATTVLENACDENGRLIVENTRFFGMTAGSGEFYTMGKKVGYIGKSVGRTDIKY